LFLENDRATIHKPREQSGFTDGRHKVSPDSEQIEPTVTTSQKVKLCESGVNQRQARAKRE